MKIGAGEKLERHQFAAPNRAFYLPASSLATDSLHAVLEGCERKALADLKPHKIECNVSR
jgi:hypothetical protein